MVFSPGRELSSDFGQSRREGRASDTSCERRVDRMDYFVHADLSSNFVVTVYLAATDLV